MSKMPKNKVIAITGSIGSGKSSVSKIIKKLGLPVLDLDDVVKELYQDEKIVREINKIVLKKDSSIFDAKKIANILFNNDVIQKQVENYLYPMVYEVMNQFIEANKISFVEMALLFEKKWDKYFDEIVCVNTNKEIVYERLMKYRHFSKSEIDARLTKQIDIEEKVKKSHYVIENNSDENILCQNVIQYLKERGFYE